MKSADTEPKKLFVLTFDSPLSAQEALLAVARLGRAGCLELHDAVFVSRSKDGSFSNVQETRDPSVAQSALGAGFLGLLFGAMWGGPAAALVGAGVGAAATAAAAKLAGRLLAEGVDEDTVERLRLTIRPGSTALAILVSRIDRLAVLDELTRFAGAELFESDVTPDLEEAVREALERNAQHATPAAPAH